MSEPTDYAAITLGRCVKDGQLTCDGCRSVFMDLKEFLDHLGPCVHKLASQRPSKLRAALTYKPKEISERIDDASSQ